jgi:glycosyltransferase involved in cell wall biosynthesis
VPQFAERVHAVIAQMQTGQYFNQLVGRPKPHSRRSAPEVMFLRESEGHPAHTIIIPTFEHAATIARNLKLMEAACTLPHDLIIIDDASSDQTAEICVSYLQHAINKRLIGATVLRNPVPIFETACDNIGFVITRTECFIEVQADIQIHEHGFDQVLSAALQDFPTSSTISGRAGHAYLDPPNRWPWDRARFTERQLATSVGLMNEAIQNATFADQFKGFVYQVETVNRGPWALRKTDLLAHGYLDEGGFFLGADDHDLNRRMFEGAGRRPLYVPLNISSPLADGAQRRQRTGVNAEVWSELRSSRSGSAEYHRFLKSLSGKRTGPTPIRWQRPQASLGGYGTPAK